MFGSLQVKISSHRADIRPLRRKVFSAEKNASVGDGGGVVWLFFYLRSMCRRTTSTTSRKPAREMAAVERKTMFTPAATPLAAVWVS